MTQNWWQILESAPFAAALRQSIYAYPLVNAGHILGVALVVGSTLPLNVRVLGAWPTVPLTPLRRVLGLFTYIGLPLVILSGFLLFSVGAEAYAESPVFRVKMLALIVGLASTTAVRRLTNPARAPGAETGESDHPSTRAPAPPRAARIAAAASLIIWPTVLLLGRLIAYF